MNSFTMILLGLLNCFLHLSGTVGASDSKHVEQKPPFIIRKYGDSVNNEIKCSHNITNYYVILWYKQDRGKSLKLLGYLFNNNPNYEEDLEERIRFDGDGRKESTLRVTDLNFNDSALYFCAASGTGSEYEAYFGQGTKLTVLDPNFKVTPPTVKLLGPSSKENGKHRNGKKTLVCVASKFYPDHVSVSWYFNDVLTNGLVASDHSATWLGESYRITSRLSVSVKDWENPNNRFKCEVSFFNGTATTQHQSETLWGEKNDQSTSVKREKFLKITQTAKLSYCVFIMKSCVYGAFVVFLFWRLQSSREKQNS